MRHRIPTLLTLLAAFVCLSQPAFAQPAPKVKDKEASLLISEPKTPEALFDAVVLMLDLERPNLAQQYLDQLAAKPLDDATILKIRDKHGPGVFLRLGNDRRFHPYSAELLESMNAAFRRFAADPARMNKLLEQLKAGPEARENAIIQLRSTGVIAVPRMLASLATADPKERDSMIYALTRMGKSIAPAIVGALDSPSEQVQIVAIETLGWVGSTDDLAYLWHPAFGPKSPAGTQQIARQAISRLIKGDPKRAGEITAFGAVTQLERIVTSHFRNTYEWSLNDDEQVELWSWDQQAKLLKSDIVAPRMASLMTGSRLARQALELAPDRERLQAMYLAIRLALDAYVAGPGKSLPKGPSTAHDVALEAGPELSLSVLEFSLKNPNSAATMAAIEVLGQVGSKRLLETRNGQASPLLAALNHPSFAVQFATASTILQFDPDTTFRGAHRVVEILKRALNDAGSQHAVVIDPNQERGATSGGRLSQLHFEPAIATTGQDGFRLAADRGDVGLIIVHAACIQWGISQTIANLRADSRTAGIPIVIYGPENIAPNVSHLLTDYPLVSFTTEGEASFRRGIESLLSRVEVPPGESDRGERIRAAGFWFAHIADGRRTNVFDLSACDAVLFEASNAAAVGVNAVIGLGAIATPAAQERLQEIAVAAARPSPLREAAALQLAVHFQNHGVLISKTKVAELKAALEKSPEPGLRQALAAVIGALRPEQPRVLELLNGLPAPALPVKEME